MIRPPTKPRPEICPRAETQTTHPAWGVAARPEGVGWILRWRSPFQPGGMDCRIDSLACDAATFRAHHEQTRSWSPFNYGLFARVHRSGGALLAVRGERVFVDAAGGEARSPLQGAARLRFLIDELGIDEAFARSVPDDVPMPPPPGSAAARSADPYRDPDPDENPRFS